ncbi:MAG: TGS domain-containing protein [Calditrichaeota bacterium]|nr:MAG: TGS domain-containing protein [Calditrichota bacterium]
MPANLSPDYYRAETEYRKAATPQARLQALKSMLAAIPKHKGTEKMQADLKRRIASLREEMQKGSRKKGFSVRVEKEGGGQVCLVGAPNSGKSSLIAALTGAAVEIGDYPFTTRHPQPVMMAYEDIQIQLVDLPPICRHHTDMGLLSIVRACDLILALIDLASPRVLEELEDILAILEESHLKPVSFMPQEDYWAATVEKRVWIVGCKRDLDVAETWNMIKELYAPRFGMSAVSARTGLEIERLRGEIYTALDIIRVYTKKPGRPAEMEQPYILRHGSNLLHFAQTVHKDFSEHLKFARVWGHTRFDGMMVNRDYVLQDKDIVELHI